MSRFIRILGIAFVGTLLGRAVPAGLASAGETDSSWQVDEATPKIQFPFGIPPKGEDTDYPVPEPVIVQVAQAKAEQVWGPVRLGPVIPCCDALGRTVAYYVCFHLDDTPFPDFDSVLDNIRKGRELRKEGLLELARRGLPPTPIDPHAYETGRIPADKSVKYDQGRRQTWGADEFVTVLVSASYSWHPIPEYFEGLPRFFTLADVIADVAAEAAGDDVVLTRIYFAGRLDQVYEFSASDGSLYYVDPYPCTLLSPDEFSRKIPEPSADCTPDPELVRNRRDAWDDLELGNLPHRSTHRVEHWDWVPILLWTGGCSPTSASMVLGLWDNKQHTSFYGGYGRLIDWYRNERQYPGHGTGPVRTNIPNTLDELRYAMGTDADGATGAYDIDDGIRDVTNGWPNYYDFNVSEDWDCPWPWEPCWNWCWEIITEEVNADRPFVWSVWYSEAAHSLAAWGYQDDQDVGVYNTWDEQEHWWCHDKYGNNCQYDVTHIQVNKLIPGGSDYPNDIYLDEPKGGENWDACEAHDIWWYQCGSAITEVYIFYSLNGGVVFGDVAQDVPSDEGWNLYSWTPINYHAGSETRIVVWGLDSSGTLVASDGSYGNFTVEEIDVLAPPTLQSPSNGATCQGTSGTLDWSSVSGAVGYLVQIDTCCGCGTIHNVTSSLYPYSGLQDGTAYYWRVRTKNVCGEYGSWSSCFSFATDPDPLPAPTLYSPSNGATCQGTSGTLDWSNVSGAAGYRVQIGTTCGSGGEHNVTSSHYSYSGLSVGMTYYWRVKTKNACGTYGSYSSCFSFTTAPTPLGPPSLQSPWNGATCESTSGTLDWSNVSGAAGYRVQIGTTCGSGGEHNVTSSQYSYSGLSAETVYFWRVKTKNGCGDYGGYSSCFSFTTRLTLDDIEILGPSSVDENSTQDYDCRVYYVDGTNELLEPSWSEDSPYATISGTGLLTTESVEDDELCVISAVYTECGVTRSDSLDVTIVDVCCCETPEDGVCCQLFGDVVGQFGNPNPGSNCDVDVFDIYCVLDGYSSGSGWPDVCPEGDLVGNSPTACDGNGTINVFDIYAVLNAFRGVYSCPHPCSPELACPAPPGLAGVFGPPGDDRDLATAGSAVLRLVPSTGQVRPGQVVTLDVYIGEVWDVRGYQVAIEAVGGRRGALVLEQITADTERVDYVFGDTEGVLAADESGGRVANVLFSDGVQVDDGAYLATFVFRASADAAGVFQVAVRAEDTLLGDSVGQAIGVSSLSSVTVEVVRRPLYRSRSTRE